jgi:hypothetical protein
MIDALVIYEKLLGPQEGFFSTLLYNSDFAEDVDARLQLCYDLRYRPKPTWQFADFSKGNLAEITELTRSEIYGFLKAKFPNKNWRKFIMEKVKEEVLEEFEKFPETSVVPKTTKEES